MSYSLEKFAADCHDALKSQPRDAGRQAVCGFVKKALKDDDFVGKYLTNDAPERKVIYEDPELGFCILAHNYQGAKDSKPHDHGPSWAIYGQARGETLMKDWALLEPASAEKPGKVRHVRDYSLKPGDAYVYNEGDLHSPRRDGPTQLIRIEGMNMDRCKRFPYEAV